MRPRSPVGDQRDQRRTQEVGSLEVSLLSLMTAAEPRTQRRVSGLETVKLLFANARLPEGNGAIL